MMQMCELGLTPVNLMNANTSQCTVIIFKHHLLNQLISLVNQLVCLYHIMINL